MNYGNGFSFQNAARTVRTAQQMVLKSVTTELAKYVPSDTKRLSVRGRLTVCLFMYLFINKLTLGSVWKYILSGADVHSPRSTFLRLLAQMDSDLPNGDDKN